MLRTRSNIILAPEGPTTPGDCLKPPVFSNREVNWNMRSHRCGLGKPPGVPGCLPQRTLWLSGDYLPPEWPAIWTSCHFVGPAWYWVHGRWKRADQFLTSSCPIQLGDKMEAYHIDGERDRAWLCSPNSGLIAPKSWIQQGTFKKLSRGGMCERASRVRRL